MDRPSPCPRGVADARPPRFGAACQVLSQVDRDLSNQERIDQIRAIQEMVCAGQAAQARLSADFDTSMRAQAAQRGVPKERQGRGIAAQIAFARRESIHRGERHLALARTLPEMMPYTQTAFDKGRISEWKATLMLRQTACLSREDRAAVDRDLAGDPNRIEGMGDREVAAEADKLAYKLDPMSFVERRRRAEAERHTSLRPAPDVMTWFTGLLPVRDGVAVHAALSTEADRRRASGDERSRSQIMADTLVERVLAPHLAGADGVTGVPLMVNVVVPDSVLFGDDDGGGWVEGYGYVPGDLIREWVAANLETGVDTWLKRIYEKPKTGELVAMDSKARRFDGGLAAFLRLRDRGCREKYCDAPVRHLDHAQDHATGGLTDAENGQGLCEAHNYAKQAIGWSAQPRPGPRHTIETTTPTGHIYQSVAPRLRPDTTKLSPAEIEFVEMIWAA